MTNGRGQLPAGCHFFWKGSGSDLLNGAGRGDEREDNNVGREATILDFFDWTFLCWREQSKK